MTIISNSSEKKIISVSRRTDILAFYSDWFLQTLKSGFVTIENPFNHKRLVLNINPENILGFVFWSRYPAGIKKVFKHIDSIFGQNHYLNYTINDYPEELEPRKPNLDKVLYLVDFLYDKYGENYIKWRFDPIFVSKATPKDFVLNKFYFLCNKLQGKVKTCITSFVDIYPKVRRRLRRNSKVELIDLSYEEQKDLLLAMKEIANDFGIELLLCCEGNLSNDLNLSPASCVNPLRFKNYGNFSFKIAPTRKDCTCYKSFDIGFYNSCLFDCIYCYSNWSYSNSLRNYLKIQKR